MNNKQENGAPNSGRFASVVETAMPKLNVRKFKLRLPADQVHTSHKKAKKLVRQVREKTAMVVALWPMQEETTRRLEAEVGRLQQQLKELEVEAMEIKRKRWCIICQEEATFMNWQRAHFYCSKRCERKDNRLYK